MSDEKTFDPHTPEDWGNMSIDDLARYFLQHPEDPGYAVFINANDGSEHNEVLRSRLKSVKNRSSYLDDLDLDDLAQYVFEYFWENGFKGWNSDDYPFVSYLYNILKPNSSLGYSIRKTESNPDALSLDNEILQGEGITGMDVLENQDDLEEDLVIENSIENIAKESGIDKTELQMLFALDDPKKGFGSISEDFMEFANSQILIPAGKPPYTDLEEFKVHIYNLRRNLKRKKQKLRPVLLE